MGDEGSLGVPAPRRSARGLERDRARRVCGNSGRAVVLRVVQHRRQLGPLRQHEEPPRGRGERGRRLRGGPPSREGQHGRARRVRPARVRVDRLRGRLGRRRRRGRAVRRVLRRDRDPGGLLARHDGRALGDLRAAAGELLPEREGERHRHDRDGQGVGRRAGGHRRELRAVGRERGGGRARRALSRARRRRRHLARRAARLRRG